MYRIEIEKLPNGAHRTQSFKGTLPAGWALLPSTLECENFPYGEVETDYINGILTVTNWIPLPIPAPEPIAPSKQRENAYDTEEIIEWDGEMITVTAASQLWQYYAAEASEKAAWLSELIAAAKADIRNRYPDLI